MQTNAAAASARTKHQNQRPCQTRTARQLSITTAQTSIGGQPRALGAADILPWLQTKAQALETAKKTPVASMADSIRSTLARVFDMNNEWFTAASALNRTGSAVYQSQ